MIASSGPRYPDLEVSTPSENSLTLVAAVRHALRQARVDREEISRFSSEALTSERCEHRVKVCRSWVKVRR